jgi:hypothetical protein
MMAAIAMGLSDWLRPPRYLLLLFAGVTVVPAAAARVAGLAVSGP